MVLSRSMEIDCSVVIYLADIFGSSCPKLQFLVFTEKLRRHGASLQVHKKHHKPSIVFANTSTQLTLRGKNRVPHLAHDLQLPRHGSSKANQSLITRSPSSGPGITPAWWWRSGAQATTAAPPACTDRPARAGELRAGRIRLLLRRGQAA
jgi:hypothetical protein